MLVALRGAAGVGILKVSKDWYMDGEIVKHDYNGFLISQRKSDGYACLTDMA